MSPLPPPTEVCLLLAVYGVKEGLSEKPGEADKTSEANSWTASLPYVFSLLQIFEPSLFHSRNSGLLFSRSVFLMYMRSSLSLPSPWSVLPPVFGAREL